MRIWHASSAGRACVASVRGSSGTTDPARSEVVSLQAYSILLLAEDFCSGVPLSDIDTSTSALSPGEPHDDASSC